MVNNQQLNIESQNKNINSNQLKDFTDTIITTSSKDNAKKKWFWQLYRRKKSHEESSGSSSLRNLFRYATLLDIVYMIVGGIASCVLSVTLPLDLFVFGSAIDSFNGQLTSLCSLNFTSLSEEYCPPNITLTSSNYYETISLCNLTESNSTNTNYDLRDHTNKQIIFAIVIACVSLVSGYIRLTMFSIAAERQTRAMKQKLFQSILKKDIVFFDKYKTGELSTLLLNDVDKIRDGIGTQLSSIITTFSVLLISIIMGLTNGWKLALVLISVSPLMVAIFLVSSKFVEKFSVRELKAYGKAGSIAEEVLSSIRTVLCYNGQDKEIQRYEQHLDHAKKYSIRKSIVDNVSNGTQAFIIYGVFALGFWYGAKLIREENYSIGNVYSTFMIIIVAVLSLQQISPQLQALFQARAAAHNLQKVIDEPSKINDKADIGITKEDLIGDIQFSNVYFAYPSRSEIPVLHNLSFNVKCGQTIAFVGSSGSGKSTSIQLLQRFYDPSSGSILLDGKELHEYNLKWLRQQIGVVSQEPVLFQATIRENILFGRNTATDQEIQDAAKMANAHDFIITLPDKYETKVGERGAALSGGQKQRIAIARALIRNPKILLLDEATSALDNESEKIVQTALDRAAQGRTTLVIAHRLPTIRNADKIIVMHKGEIVEEGDHESLMNIRGTYYNLVEQQSLRQAEDEEQLKIERQKSTNTVRSQRSYIEPSEPSIHRSLSIFSLGSIGLNRLYGRQGSTTRLENLEPKPKRKPHLNSFILQMNKPEWILIIVGCIAAVFNGAIYPVFGVIQTKIVVLFQECDRDTQRQQIIYYALIYTGLGIFAFVVQSVQGCMFAYSGGNLTRRLRSKAFRALLRQDITYFDEPEQNTGALCARLATEASDVQNASGVRFGFLFQNFVSMCVGIVIGLVFSWQITLIFVAFFPLILFGAYIQIRITNRFADMDKISVENAGKISMEAIQNIRTVVQLTSEDYFYEEYCRLLDTLYRSSLKQAHITSVIFGISTSAFTFATAAVYSVSTTLIQQNIITFEDMFMAYNCVALISNFASGALMLTPNYGKALNAAERIYNLLKRKPLINNESKDGDEISNFTGQLEFRDVSFAYPNRAESIILNKFQLTIEPGQKVALVGASGCGKSTTIQLIERLYDVNNGELLVDSKDIRSLNLHWYRSQISLVSQEPVLFDISVRENIAYGDNSRKDIPLIEIIEAAKSANIHDFIQQLPQGYETNCGAKGTQLSGGQKQRIAIARALVRNPKILLLDEATSALDSESEKIVQDALERAQQNRTSITIAHRLSTIQNSDVICFVYKGRIVESGTHEELLTLGDRYYRLAQGKLK